MLSIFFVTYSTRPKCYWINYCLMLSTSNYPRKSQLTKFFLWYLGYSIKKKFKRRSFLYFSHPTWTLNFSILWNLDATHMLEQKLNLQTYIYIYIYLVFLVGLSVSHTHSNIYLCFSGWFKCLSLSHRHTVFKHVFF